VSAMPDASTPPPIVCTLTTKDRSARSVEWTDVASLALTGEPLPNGARSTFGLNDADAIEDLAERERSCCGSWLRIETARTDVLTMTVTTDNADGLELIRSMAGVSP